MKESITQSASNINSTQVFYMPSLFNETVDLLNDARDYFSYYGDDDQNRINPKLHTLYSGEMSRITLRLSSIMSWIMAQRAVIGGKITTVEAAQRFGLEYQDICLVDNRALHGVLPSYVCYLLDRSLELYERVDRLDNACKSAVH